MEGTASVVGAGPNGLAAAVVMARAGLDVTVWEAAATPGGATRSAALLGPGTVTDLGSAVHPFGVASPLFTRLGLERHGLRWSHPLIPLAHPLDGGPAALLRRSLQETCRELGRDGRAWSRVHAGVVDRWEQILPGVLGPLLRVPEHPLALTAFGLRGAWPAAGLARAAFRDEPARALFAGSAAHAVLPLTRPLTAAFGVLFGAAGHATGWPVARGGSQAIADALVADLHAHGGTVKTGAEVRDLSQVRPADVVLLDLTPRQVLRLRGVELPKAYARALARWRYGTASYKVDYLLDGPVPWLDERVRDAATVHVAGTLAEVVRAEADVHAGRHPERPFVLVAQQGAADASRAPGGSRVLWAYAHTPHGSPVPIGQRIDAQIERFAPGFRDRVTVRIETTPAELERFDANLVGGDIGGGALDGLQQVFRPVAGTVPYATGVRTRAVPVLVLDTARRRRARHVRRTCRPRRPHRPRPAASGQSDHRQHPEGQETTVIPDDRDKLVALSASGALLAAVLAPMRQHWRKKARDGFPLSYYPMFSARRKRHGTVTYLVGRTATGSRRLLHYSYAGTGGLNQVRRQLRRTVRDGRAADVAVLVASRVATRPRRGDGAVTQVQVVTGRYAYDDFFNGRRAPVSEEVHATTAVPRTVQQAPS